MIRRPVLAAMTLVAALLLGTPALSILGAFGAALTVGLRRGGLLMSLAAKAVSDAAADHHQVQVTDGRCRRDGDGDRTSGQASETDHPGRL